MKFIGIIPARYSSSRFPGKPLAILGGKAVIEHVYRQVSSVMEDVFVATDDQRIYDAVEAFGGKAIMTRSRVAQTESAKPSTRWVETLMSLSTYKVMNLSYREVSLKLSCSVLTTHAHR